MPTSTQSLATYFPRKYSEHPLRNEKAFVKQLNVEQFQSSTNHFISISNRKRKRVKILIVLSVIGGVIILLLCILLPILIGRSQLSTTTTTSLPMTFNWNRNGITTMGITGQAGVGSNQLGRPFGLYIDRFNNLYVSDSTNHRIEKYSLNSSSSSGITVAGQASGTSGTGNNYFQYCSDVVLDSNQNIYVADILNHRIQVWLNGASSGTTSFGTGTASNGNNSLNSPYGIAYNSMTNQIYVADTSNQRIISYQIGSSTGTVIGGGNGNGTGTNQLSRPQGIFYDSSTNSLFIANSAANNVVQWIIGQSHWNLIAGNLNGLPGSSSTELNYPGDVYLDSYRNVYVADTKNHRIQFYYSGQTNGTTIAGITNISGSNATLLNAPRSITLDYQFNLYVSDTENNRIQKFSYVY